MNIFKWNLKRLGEICLLAMQLDLLSLSLRSCEASSGKLSGKPVMFSQPATLRYITWSLFSLHAEPAPHALLPCSTICIFGHSASRGHAYMRLPFGFRVVSPHSILCLRPNVNIDPCCRWLRWISHWMASVFRLWVIILNALDCIYCSDLCAFWIQIINSPSRRLNRVPRRFLQRLLYSRHLGLYRLV